MEEEVNLFMQEFDLNEDGKVSWEEFKSSMTRIKEKMDEKAQKAKEYTSYEEFKHDRTKHRRMHGELTDKYKGPLTFNQSVGFKVNDPREKEIMEMDAYPKTK